MRPMNEFNVFQEKWSHVRGLGERPGILLHEIKENGHEEHETEPSGRKVDEPHRRKDHPKPGNKCKGPVVYLRV